MVFSSLVFLFVFLPLVLFVYYLSPRRMRNGILFAVSLVFYAWGEPIYIVLMIFSTFADYAFGLALSNSNRSDRFRKWIVFASVVVNLSVLSFFKYADFVIETINGLAHTEIPLVELPLPIGISFYTFQSLSYIIDVYRKEAEAQRNWVDFGAYVSLFPQLVAGPIVKYHTIAEQLQHRRESIPLFAEGVRRFLIGLGKKVLLANNIGLLWDTISHSSMETMPLLTAWLGILAFALQIYFDFSGYSDMAIGLGLMFGFRFEENFRYPYTAESMTDFWRRWHISLGSWFRDYVYIPLGGNRHGLPKQLRNIAIVWLLTGLWHGASWNYVLWGAYFGLLLVLEKMFWLRALEKVPKWFRHVYALLAIAVGWVIFVFEDFGDMTHYFVRMFTSQNGFYDDTTLYYVLTEGPLIIIAILASLPIMKNVTFKSWHIVLYMMIYLMSIAYLVDASFNPFLYFRF